MTGRPNRLILSGYGPLAGMIAAVLLITLLVPSKPSQDAGLLDTPTAGAAAPGTGVGGVPATRAGAISRGTGQDAAQPRPQAAQPRPQGERAAATPTRESGGPGRPGAQAGRGSDRATDAGSRRPAASRPGPAAAPAREAAGAAAAGTAAPAGGVRAASNCAGGRLQVAGSPYSPTCVRFGGDNGGATSRGVTGDTIRIAIRQSADSGSDEETDSEIAQQAEDAGITASKADRDREMNTLVKYFNDNYELYGRKVELVRYTGRGSTQAEIAGGGQTGAKADAVKVAQEIQAFADISATTQPYLDALVRQKVVSIGGIHLPSSYYAKRAPYAWGQLIDCTTLMNSAIDLLAKRLPPDAAASRAGSASLREKQRTYGLVFPDDAVYSQCIDEARPSLDAAGIDIAKEIRYGLDFAKLQQEAPNIAAQLKAAGVTTLLLVTDPLLPFFLTGAATQQDFYPEWFVSGTIGTDTDVAGQFYDSDQWQFAYGQSYLTGLGGQSSSEARKAFAAVSDRAPTATVDLTYQTLLMLFTGLQNAGPNLTPQTYARGMFDLGTRTGAYGQWSFSPDDYTSVDDAREFYYDPAAISPFNDQPGRAVPVNGGKRYVGATWPVKDPPVPAPPPVAP